MRAGWPHTGSRPALAAHALSRSPTINRILRNSPRWARSGGTFGASRRDGGPPRGIRHQNRRSAAGRRNASLRRSTFARGKRHARGAALPVPRLCRRRDPHSSRLAAGTWLSIRRNGRTVGHRKHMGARRSARDFLRGCYARACAPPCMRARGRPSCFRRQTCALHTLRWPRLDDHGRRRQAHLRTWEFFVDGGGDRNSGRRTGIPATSIRRHDTIGHGLRIAVVRRSSIRRALGAPRPRSSDGIFNGRVTDAAAICGLWWRRPPARPRTQVS